MNIYIKSKQKSRKSDHISKVSNHTNLVFQPFDIQYKAKKEKMKRSLLN